MKMNESETRQKVIEQLEELKSDYQKRVSNPIYDGEEPRRKLNALDFAICSIKTDLKYDLLYEDDEVYTKANIMAMLTELKTEIDKQCKIPNNNASSYDWNNGVYSCYKVVQQKIDKLKGEQE